MNLYLLKLLKKILSYRYFFLNKSQKKKIHFQKVIESTSYNMLTDENEKYYSNQYFLLLKKFLPKDSSSTKIFDLGCGQGRMTFCLSKFLKKSYIESCDISSNAINFANSKKKFFFNKNRISFHLSSIKSFIKNKNKNSVDLILLTEVSFFYPELDKIFPSLLNLLKKGGIIAISYRPTFFYGLILARNKLFENFHYLLKYHSGNIMNSPITFCWKSKEDIIKIFKKYKLKMLDICGIGCFSGIDFDPNENIIKPKDLSFSNKKKLMNYEIIFGKKYPDMGRYIFAIGKK